MTMGKDCKQVDSLVTPYVDGELDSSDRQAIDAHNRLCSPCRTRVVVEQSVRDLLHDRQAALRTDAAPDALKARCRSVVSRQSSVGARHSPIPGPQSLFPRLRARLGPLALAASLVLLVGGAFLYEATSRSSHLLAAELTADHLKCFAANSLLGIRQESPSSANTYLAASFGWPVNLPQLPNLHLVASRPCLYGEGRAAHVMYRQDGRDVSLFMLPGIMRNEEVLEVMGHEAAIWSTNGRTFVLISRESRDDLQRLASTLRRTVR